MKLQIHPLTITEARSFVARHHRHHKAPQGGLFAIGCSLEGADEPCGVVIIGRPVARMSNDGYTCEVTRLCTDGTKNACSLLYGAARRAASALGYRRIVTYTLPEEGGASMRACGWRCVGLAGGGSWSREGRPRVDMHPTQQKFRWEADCNPTPAASGG